MLNESLSVYEYFKTDFDDLKINCILQAPYNDVEGVMHWNLVTHTMYVSLYIKDYNADDLIKILESLVIKRQITLPQNTAITLPNARNLHNKTAIEVKNDDPFIINIKMPDVIPLKSLDCFKDFHNLNIYYIYANQDFGVNDINKISSFAENNKILLHFRGQNYAKEKNKKPLAFISYAWADQEEVIKIATKLRQMGCPVWFDKFSLKIGDSLQEKIMDGIKSAGKCILFLSDNYIKNTSWAKTEFQSIVMKEMIEEKKNIIPIWHNVDKNSIYAFYPLLVDRPAVQYSQEKRDDCIVEIYNIIKQ